MVLATVRGEFTDYSANILFDENDVTKSSIEGSIKVASINTGNEKRDNHLRSSDFFDAENHPEITFKSRSIVKDGDDYAMLGSLTIRGVTRDVQIPFHIVGTLLDPWGNKRLGLEAELTINRQDYGVSWNKALDNGGVVVSDDVKIELIFEGIRKKTENAD
jgi:polyisoprenoid-binding protein YceI